ncbi:hypothetical protein SAMN05421578_102451 [Paenibacillus macquariensis]|uniref:Uncharacterized protein n=1 Tax=Paenibacillus macquariensis TaxID=948756 RepID=A0ABY1JPD2_9BACL|nr:hypothetical protein SAMN05421578_102451 [Paenibacillus macquariensis]
MKNIKIRENDTRTLSENQGPTVLKPFGRQECATLDEIVLQKGEIYESSQAYHSRWYAWFW